DFNIAELTRLIRTNAECAAAYSKSRRFIDIFPSPIIRKQCHSFNFYPLSYLPPPLRRGYCAPQLPLFAGTKVRKAWVGNP
ncbi:hypothetical protein L9F63_004736, partial [Diploptera punctata]